MIDWAAIQPFGRPGSPIRLREGNRALHRLRPSELADLLEELGRASVRSCSPRSSRRRRPTRSKRWMPEELESLLRESGEEQAAALLAVMEPDEAVDALRDLEEDEREQLLGMMPEEKAAELRRAPRLRGAHRRRLDDELPPDRAPRATPWPTCAARLADDADHQADLPGVLVVDNEGRLVDDISLFELLVAEPDDDHERLVR